MNGSAEFGSIVMGHECVERAPGSDTLGVTANPAIRAGKIARVDFARGR